MEIVGERVYDRHIGRRHRGEAVLRKDSSHDRFDGASQRPTGQRARTGSDMLVDSAFELLLITEES